MTAPDVGMWESLLDIVVCSQPILPIVIASLAILSVDTFKSLILDSSTASVANSVALISPAANEVVPATSKLPAIVVFPVSLSTKNLLIPEPLFTASSELSACILN